MKPAYHSIVPLETLRIRQAPTSVVSLDLRRGSVIVDPLRRPWVFEVDMDVAEPPHLLGGPFPMASERLLSALSAAGVHNIQTFPVVLRLRGAAEWRRHSALNVIGLLDVADLTLSDGEVLAEGDDGPTQIAFNNLHLSGARTRGLPVFRLFHDPATLLVDDRVLRALNRDKPLEGWGFFAVEIQVTDPAGVV